MMCRHNDYGIKKRVFFFTIMGKSHKALDINVYVAVLRVDR